MVQNESKLTAGLAIASAFFGFAALAQGGPTNVNLPNFHQVSAQLYRGGQPTQFGIEFLARQGIKTMVNLRAADEDSRAEQWWVEQAGMRYLNVPMCGRGRPTEAQVQAVTSFINAPENQPVFLHCKRGKDRTGTIVACYRVSRDHWTSQRAIQEARKLGMRWTQFGMKNYIRDYYRRQFPDNVARHTPAKLQALIAPHYR